ncbi:type I polyketide synthase [Kitasatospora purpeofusca]|uniref:type I polyketide synthase n=1 Tax=Kitasatospora purpeofusca TaxID=67352 RepID=UPI0036D34C67
MDSTSTSSAVAGPSTSTANCCRSTAGATARRSPSRTPAPRSNPRGRSPERNRKRKRNREDEESVDESIAVVGMGCRFPSAPDLRSYWSVLRSGVSVIAPPPGGPLPGVTSRPAAGGFIAGPEQFDADFFGISPKEAAALDPQQRLALEVAWESLEDAAIRPAALAERGTGVFFGAMRDDYAVVTRRRGPAGYDLHTFTGLQRSMIANRVSYTLRFGGPSMTVDTGQSSSLVALHLACESILRGETDAALAGGVNLLLDRDGAAGAGLFGALSPDGRCRPLDEAANGFVPGEGVGVVLLKPLSAALADGDRIYCVVRGSGVNNDGGGPGLTHPSVVAQKELLRRVNGRAGTLGAVHYVELHATGTPAGDSVEAAAVGGTLGAARDGGDAVVVGSVKAAIGHLEAAAGIAGFIKAVLSVWHRAVVPQPNYRAPSRRIRLDELNLRVPREFEDWSGQDAPMVAAVDSFGLGGTNCHVVLAPAPPVTAPEPRTEDDRGGHVHVISARSREALRAQARALLGLVTPAARVVEEPPSPEAGEATGRFGAPAEGPSGEPPQLLDLAYSLATTRTAFEWRAGVVARDRAELCEGLARLAEGSPSPGLHQGRVCDRPGTAFLFAGQGTQRPGMGRDLYRSRPVFAEAFDEVAEALGPYLPRPLASVVFADPGTDGAALLDDTAYTQPALFALEVALHRMLTAWGVRPDALAGHSVGELAAAQVAGVFSLPDAALLVARRGQLMSGLPTGAMAAVEGTEEEVAPLLAEHGGRVSLAAVNGPRAVVVSGEPDDVRAVAAEFKRRGARTRVLRVARGFHSPQVDAVLADFAAVANSLTYWPPDVPIASTLTGTWVRPEELTTAGYWVDQLRGTVRFLDAVRTIAQGGTGHFVELGPDATLASMASRCLPAQDEPHQNTIALLSDTISEPAAVSGALAELYLHGLAVDWQEVFRHLPARRTALPTYAFQRRAHWLAPSGADSAEQPTPAEQPTTAGQDGPGRAAPAAPVTERAVLDLLLGHASALLGHRPGDRIDPRRSFEDLGVNSLTAVQLSEALGAAVGLSLPDTLTYDHPTPLAAAAEVTRLLSGPAELADTQRAATAPAPERSDDPVAVIALGCRLPGGITTPDELWSLLRNGRDAVSDFPRDRGWDLDALFAADPDAPGTTYVRRACFLQDAAQFDAGLFGISPREAGAMDPQQRLLLETAWETWERAGLPVESLRGSPTGVFIGATAQEYGPRMHEAAGEAAGYALTGTTPSVASGRLAYTFGLTGPALTVDTACSSSLVAVHLACRSLAAGECELALAGGVAVLSSPGMWVEFSRQRGLAPDGRCKPFAAAADGTAWSEGAALVLLERLSAARRNGHPVLALLRGSAVNQDGASSGLSAPNGPAQERVIRSALADAGVSAASVDVVEAHGTGTTLGDPIEAQALGRVYGEGRDDGRPLLLGSLKSNIGHSQAAAGAAGLVKTVLALQHEELPASLNVDAPSPRVDWRDARLRLLTESVDWPRKAAARRAGVSSFGISGTNVHVIVEEAPDGAAEQSTPDGRPAAAWDGPALPWTLSAGGPEALRAQADRLARAVRSGSLHDPRDVGRSLATTRSALDHRAAVVGDSPNALLAGLDALARSAPGEDDTEGAVTAEALPAHRTVFVFPGQGSQWPGMARGLLAASPVFRAHVEACDRALSAHCDWSLLSLLSQDAQAPTLERDDVVQPALFAVMTGLAQVWRAHGVAPDAVVGHSQGELAAAWVAGALTLEDALLATVTRSRLVGTLATGGAMLALRMPAPDVEALLRDGFPGLGVAVFNGPWSTVVSGPREEVERLVARCDDQGVRTARIAVNYASHCADIDTLREPMAQALAGLAPRPARIPFHSTVTADTDPRRLLDGAYWYANLRRPVRFEPTVRELLSAGYDTFVEMSPHPLLALGIQETADSQDPPADVTVLPSLHRGAGEPGDLLLALARAWCHGLAVDWTTVFGDGRRVALPTYAFQHSRYWLSPDAAGPGADRRSESEQPLWDAVDRQDAAAVAAVLGLADEEPVRGVVPALAAWRSAHRTRARLGDLCFAPVWTPLVVPSASAARGRWLLVTPDADAGPWPRDLAVALGSPGTEVRTVTLPTGAERAAAAGLLRPAVEEWRPDGIVSFLALRPDGAAPAGPLADTATLLQALDDLEAPASVWCATRCAVRVDEHDVVVDPGQAALWGFGRAAAQEYPDRWAGLLDLPPEPDAESLRRACAALALPAVEDQVAVRSGGTYAHRLREAAVPAGRGWTPRGTVLITGGTGFLGAQAARVLAAAGAPHLLLLSRHGGGTTAAAELVTELEALGARVTVAACDVGDRAALAAVLATVPPAFPLKAVVHTAGAFETAMIDHLTTDHLDRVLAAKTLGARHLHELTAGDDLDAFVLYSSVVGAIGMGGHSAYGAANAWLDALAEQRRARGLPATSIAWGYFPGGLGKDGGDWMAERGLPPLDLDATGALLPALAAGSDPRIVLSRFDWPTFLSNRAPYRPGPFLDDLPAVQRARQEQAAGEQRTAAGLPADYPRLPRARQRQVLAELVRSTTAAVLGHRAPDAVAPNRPFKELGLDSLAAVQLRNRLAHASGLRLPTGLAFSHPTPADLADHLQTLLAAEAGQPEGGGEQTAEQVGRPTGAAPSAEPIAVLGMACRLPGGIDSPRGLWRLLEAGTDAISSFPEDRGWDLTELYDADPAAPGKSYVTAGGFLEAAADFDAEFFGISPREALSMDPQQRLLLETSWEALERAGIDPGSLRGSSTGVFAGAVYQDYGARAHEAPQEMQGYLTTGKPLSVISGRVAYVLGLQGPAVSVDTACSSSLVAVHLACQSLLQRDSALALAGGVTVIASPGLFIEFSRQRALSPDGRCRSFAAEADGTGFAEGAGMVVLERLSDARRHGHPVLAVIRSSAINQDGASNGLTAPNGESQQRVIRQALARAELGGGDIDLIEAHGTGTTLGDPIEAEALLATYGRGRPAGQPVYLGSLKSNVGHTQAAAGVAGLIKTVLALRHESMPKTLHATTATPHVDWGTGDVRLLTDAVPWPGNGRPRRAAVSAFGVSGTNAHVIVEQAPTAPEPAAPPEPTAPPVVAPPVWLLSAHTEAALRAQAQQVHAHLRTGPAASAEAVGRALATTRAQLSHRAAITAPELDGCLRALGALADGSADPDLVTGTAADGRTVFVFAGQGSQWPGMAARLIKESPVFADGIAACGRALAPHTDWSLDEVLLPGAAEALERVDVVQPALFAVQLSLARLWSAAGARPSAVVGHSQGEIAAACFAGALSLEDAALVVALRSRMLTRLSGGHGLLALQLSHDEVLRRLEHYPGLCVATVNGPRAVVVAGPTGSLDVLEAECRVDQVRARRIQVGYAAHSPQVDELRTALTESLTRVTPAPGDLDFYSSVTGAAIAPDSLDAAYWFRNLREPVRFDLATRALVRDGYRFFVEPSVHPLLSGAVLESADAEDRTAVALPTLHREEGGLRHFTAAVAKAHVEGLAVDTAALNPLGTEAPPELPTYPFQHRRFWVDTFHGGTRQELAVTLSASCVDHPLLDIVLPEPEHDGFVLTGRVSPQSHPWLRDHALDGVPLLPGTSFVDLALCAGRESGCPDLAELTLLAPLQLGEEDGAQLHLTVSGADPSGRRNVTIRSRPHTALTGEPWTLHARGVLAPSASPPGDALPGPWPPEHAVEVDVEAFHTAVGLRGYGYGPAFQGLTGLWRRGQDIFTEVRLDEALFDEDTAFDLHPALLDAALQGLLVRRKAAVELPFHWSGVRLHANGAGALRTRIRPLDEQSVTVDITDPAGHPVATIDTLTMRAVGSRTPRHHLGGEGLYRLSWKPVAPATAAPARRCTWLAADRRASVDGSDAPALHRALAALAEGPGTDLVLHRLTTAADPVPHDLAPAVHDAVQRTLALVQGWYAEERLAATRLVLLTHRAVAALPGEVPDPVGAALWGLLRSAQNENPDRLTLFDVDDLAEITDPGTGGPNPRALASLPLEAEPQLALREGLLYAPRLTRAAVPPPAPMPYGPEGTVLITGGTGTLGRLLARHLVTVHGVRSLLLLSRGGPAAAGAAELSAELADLGARCTIAACDAADRAALEETLATELGERPLSAVFHAAGVLADSTVATLTPDQVTTVLRSKVDGALNLHRATLAREPAAFVLFSGAAGIFGTPGQAHYAAANSFLDAFAECRRGLGLPALSLPWGLWAERSAMTGHLNATAVRRLEHLGIAELPAAHNLALLDEAQRLEEAVVLPLRLSGAALHHAGGVPPLLRELVRPRQQAARAEEVTEAVEHTLAGKLAEAGAREADVILTTLVRSEVVQVLGHSSVEEIEADAAFADLGFDSLTAVELRNRINRATGASLPVTAVFDHPSPAALAARLLADLLPGSAAEQAETGTRPEPASHWVDTAEDAALFAAIDGIQE